MFELSGGLWRFEMHSLWLVRVLVVVDNTCSDLGEV